ncbi:hypothetical protein TNCV_2117851 [Trichonephila clavipes]|nr:hypothetical protein TNCV_2117851 [Trichonephila clavipes]
MHILEKFEENTIHTPPIRYKAVSDADCYAFRHGFEFQRRHGCLQMHSTFAACGDFKQPLNRKSSRKRCPSHLEGCVNELTEMVDAYPELEITN